VRAGSGVVRRGLKVSAEESVDILGAYLFLPVILPSPGGVPEGVA
jgi:hypothetical protein